MAKYKEFESIEEFDIFDGSWDSIKNNVFMRLFNKENIPFGRALSDIPHSSYADLAITFSVENKTYIDNQRAINSCVITNDDMDKLNITQDILSSKANQNTQDKNSVRIETILEHSIRANLMYPLIRLPEAATMMIDVNSKTRNKKLGTNIFASPSGTPIPISNASDKGSKNVLLISNRTQTFAAINYTFPSTLQRVHDKFKEDFFIVPISVHEIICVKESFATKDGELTNKEAVEELKDMVEQINDIVIEDTSDILSYNIYHHIYDECCTMICK